MAFDDYLHGLASGYVAAPQWVKTWAGGAYALVPPAVRFGPRFARFLHHFGGLGVESDYVDDRLRQTLRAALAHVPAFAGHRRLLEGLQESPREVLRQLPLTSKEDIKTGLERYVADDWPARARLRMFTGGSTSVPMTFYLHKGVSRAKEWAAFHAMGRRFGTEGDGVILALRGRTVRSAGEGRLWMYEPIKRHLILSSDHLEPRYMPEYVRVLRQRRPSYIHAFPSALFPLVSWLRERGEHDVLDQVRCVMLTSESVFEHHLQAFKGFFRCPVIVHYGHSERVLFANTLADDPRYHFWPHYGHFELLDAQGRPVTEPGQVGEIVGTSFDNLVMPFVRYRTGDFAVAAQGPHPSMPGSPVVERIEGRLQEFVVCRDHRLITVTTLGAAHFEQLHQCLRIQYEQREPGRLLLRVVPLAPLSAPAKASIARAVADKTQGGCSVEIVEVESIPLTARGKQRLLVQHLNMDHYLGAAMDRTDGGVDPMVSALKGYRADRVAKASSSVAPRVLGELLPAGRGLMMFGTSPEMRGGIAAVVSSLRAGGLFERVHTDYVVTHVEGGPGAKLVQFLRALRDAWRLLRAGRVGLVHAHVASRGSFWRKSIVLALARHFGVPTVFHLHGGGFEKFATRGWGRSLLRWWIRRTFEASTVVVVLSQRWAQWVREFAPQSRIEVVGNPALTPEVMPDAAGRDSANGPGRVLYLGMISRPKGCYDLLRAWVSFRRQAPGWRLAVGGNGEVDQFLAEAERLGIRGDIDFLGWVSGADKDRELRRADVFVLPSYAEGMPVSVLEAMAYGVAVVTTPVGGVPDMMRPDEHGLWIRPGDVDGLAQRLADLAGSPEVRLRLAAAGREQVMGHNSVAAVISRLLQVYRRALAEERTH